MQEKEYAQIYELGLGSLIGDFFQNVKDTVTGVAKAVAPIAPFIIPFAAPALASTGIGSLLGGSVGRFLTSKLGQSAIGAGIGALAGQKPADIAKNLALQVATSGVRGALSGGQGNIGQRFMSGVTGRDVQIPTGNTEKGFFEKASDKLMASLDPTQRSINPEFQKIKVLGELSGNPISDEMITAMGIPKESSFMYQYGPLAYAGLSSLPVLENLISPPQEEEEETTSTREDLYTPNYAQYQLLDITGPQGIAPPSFAAEGGEVTGFAEGSGKQIKHPDGKVKEHPKRIGEIVGRGTGTSDDIPAMLSDGEFVMTAKAVRNAGGGSRKVGAKNMYKMMKSLENGGSLSQQSIGMA
tara:strand:- start:286 stop:1350 length:1065 start_codon:yes stop_codon:yes gene_type:complete